MQGREEFNKLGNDIMDTMDVYGVMAQTQLERMFPGSDKVLSYLTKNKRLNTSVDGLYLGQDETVVPNKARIAAINVLLDVLSKTKYHTVGTLPIQIIFTTVSGDYYEIVYVEQGKEAIVAAMFKSLGIEHGTEEHTKRIAIIEDIRQVEKVKTDIPNIVRFALAKGNLFEYFSCS